MALQIAASNLLHEEFLQDTPQFYWKHPDGTKGRPVGIDHELDPVHLGHSTQNLLAYSNKSRVLQIELVMANGEGDRVAAKIMKSKLDVEKLRNELEILQSLRHKHVAAVLGSFCSHTRQKKPEYGILVFPLATQNLQDFLEEISEHNKEHKERGLAWNPHVNAHKLLPYFACLCVTVLYLHEQRQPIKHRDIKPANILIDRVDNVILADFDISKVYEHRNEAITYGSLDGTVMYSSKDVWKNCARDDPEGSKRGLEWDVVSLGFVFLEMATVLFGKDLKKMRTDYGETKEPGRVIYSEALAKGQIHNWLDDLRETAESNTWKAPPTLVAVTKLEPDYVKKFLQAIEDMMSAEQNDDQPLKGARMTFGRFSAHCPNPKSE